MIGAEEFKLFSEQLQQLLGSNFPLAEGLLHFSGELSQPGFRQAVEQVAHRLAQGSSLSAALEAEPPPFSPEYIGLIRAGEQSNNLLKMLDTALEHESLVGRLESKLRAAVYYPAFVICFALVTYASVLTWAYPVMARLYQETNHPIPLLFRAVHAVSHGPWGIAVLAAIGGLVVMLWWIKRKQGLGSLALSVPGLGSLVADVYSARLARSLGLLLQAGVSMDNALSLVAAATSDQSMKKRMLRASRQAAEGRSLSESLTEIGLAGTRFSDLVGIGEESGILPRILISGASLFQAESESRLESVMRTTGTVLLAAAGASIGLIFASWFHTYSLIPMLAL
jgi:type II secretory pathway component PulF